MLLWVGSQATHVKTTVSGIPDLISYCVIFISCSCVYVCMCIYIYIIYKCGHSLHNTTCPRQMWLTFALGPSSADPKSTRKWPHCFGNDLLLLSGKKVGPENSSLPADPSEYVPPTLSSEDKQIQFLKRATFLCFFGTTDSEQVQQPNYNIPLPEVYRNEP